MGLIAAASSASVVATIVAAAVIATSSSAAVLEQVVVVVVSNIDMFCSSNNDKAQSADAETKTLLHQFKFTPCYLRTQAFLGVKVESRGTDEGKLRVYHW